MLTEEIEALRQEVAEESTFPQHLSDQYKTDKQVLFDALKDNLDNGSTVEEILETLKVRMGANGVERQGYIEYLLNQISDLALPSHIRSLMSDFSNQKSNNSLFCEQLLENNELTPEQKAAFDKQCFDFQQKKKQYEKLMLKMKRIRKCLLRRTGHLQNVIDYVSTLIPPQQVAALLLRLNNSSEEIKPWQSFKQEF